MQTPTRVLGVQDRVKPSPARELQDLNRLVFPLWEAQFQASGQAKGRELLQRRAHVFGEQSISVSLNWLLPQLLLLALGLEASM
jgi:hypothetical protein